VFVESLCVDASAEHNIGISSVKLINQQFCSCGEAIPKQIAGQEPGGIGIEYFSNLRQDIRKAVMLQRKSLPRSVRRSVTIECQYKRLSAWRSNDFQRRSDVAGYEEWGWLP
jgi:hypothetical protein